MRGWFRTRLDLLRASLNRPIASIPVGFVSVISLYDVFVSQLLPPELSQSVPKVWEMIVWADDYIPTLPPLGWLSVLAVMVAAISVEYATTFRRPAPAAPVKVVQQDVPKPSYYGAPPRKYPRPPEAKDLDIDTATSKELGELLEATGTDVEKFLHSFPYNAREPDVVLLLVKKKGPLVLWVYEEARKRGFTDRLLEVFYEDPSELVYKQIKYLPDQLRTLGVKVGLHP